MKTQMYMKWEYQNSHPPNFTRAADILFFQDSIRAKQNRIAGILSSKKLTQLLEDKASFGPVKTLIIKQNKIEDLFYDKRNVVAIYLASSSLLVPIVLTQGQSDTKGYYYSFLPEFNEKLFPLCEFPPLYNLVQESDFLIKSLPYFPEEFSVGEEKTSIMTKISYKDSIILIWVKLWCLLLNFQSKREHVYRVEQLLDVAGEFQRKDRLQLIELYAMAMESCNNQSSYLVIKLFDGITINSVKAHKSIFLPFLEAIYDCGQMAIKENVTLIHSFKRNSIEFLERTFLSVIEKNNFSLEEVKLASFYGECKKCCVTKQTEIIEVIFIFFKMKN